MSESDNEFPIFQFQHHFRCLAELEEELPEILFRCAEHVSHWISNKSRSELWTRPIPSECHQNPIRVSSWTGWDNYGISWDMTLWWNFGHHVIIMDININCTKQFQFETSQKTSQTMRYPWDNHGFRCHFVVIPTRPVRAQSTDGSAQQPGRVRFGSYGAAGASSATLLISWYLVNLNHIEPCWSEFSETYWQIEYWNIDIMIFNHHKHYIPLWTPHCRSVINPKN